MRATKVYSRFSELLEDGTVIAPATLAWQVVRCVDYEDLAADNARLTRENEDLCQLKDELYRAEVERVKQLTRELSEASGHGANLSEIVMRFDSISPALQKAISFFMFRAAVEGETP